MEIRPNREDEQVSTVGWSGWVRAMILDHDLPATTPCYEPRSDDHVGYICTNVRDAFEEYNRNCGIYEWQARRPGQNYVVYVGSTCRAKPGALKTRILEYCTNGSHKDEEINRALQLGYELWVRVKPVSGRKSSEKEENMMLAKYNYAWNKRENDSYRPNIPPIKSFSSMSKGN